MKFTTYYEVDFDVGPLRIQGEIEVELDYANDEDWDWDFAADFEGDNPHQEPQKLLTGLLERDETFQTALRARLERSDRFHEAMRDAIREHMENGE